MPYINPDIFQVDWDDLTDWADGDSNDCVSEIEPAGELHLDCRSASADGLARRNRDLGSIGSGDYYIELKFKGDNWGGQAGNAKGIKWRICADINELNVIIGNDLTVGDGISITGSGGLARVYTETWDNNWHTVVFYIHNSQTDCDIWVDKSPCENADVTDADVNFDGGSPDGYIDHLAWGTAAGDEEYHLDYLYVGSELAEPCPEDIEISVPTAKLVANGLTPTPQAISTVSTPTSKLVLNGLATSWQSLTTISVTTGKLAIKGLTPIVLYIKGISIPTGRLVLKALITIVRTGWSVLSKHTAVWTEQSKSKAAYTGTTKHISTWTNQSKNKEI